MSLGNRTCQALLAALFGKTTNDHFGVLGSPPTFFCGLSSTAAAEDGTNVTEPTTGSYARVETDAADWNEPTLANPSLLDNANAITFPQSTAAWLAGATLIRLVLFDASTSGNYLGQSTGNISPTRVVDAAGITIDFAAGDVDFTLA